MVARPGACTWDCAHCGKHIELADLSILSDEETEELRQWTTAADTDINQDVVVTVVRQFCSAEHQELWSKDKNAN